MVVSLANPNFIRVTDTWQSAVAEPAAHPALHLHHLADQSAIVLLLCFLLH